MDEEGLPAVYTETIDTVCWLWLNRPEEKNVLNDILLNQLWRAVHQALQDDHVRTLVLQARGPTFCAGLASSADVHHAGLMFQKLQRLTKPLVVGVQGSASGSGLALLAVATVAVVTLNATFSPREQEDGALAVGILPYLQERVARGQLRTWFQTAASLSAVQARDIGLVSWLTPEEFLDRRLEDAVRHVQTVTPDEHAEIMARLHG